MVDLITAQQIKAYNKEYLHSIPGVHTTFTTLMNGKPVIVVQSSYAVTLPKVINGIDIFSEIIAAPRKIIPELPLPRAFGIRPFPAGCLLNPSDSLSPTSPSISPTNWWGGTAGLILTKGSDKYILTCCHAMGDEYYSPYSPKAVGSPVWQPDNSSNLNLIATLYNHIPLLQPPGSNNVDYSLFKVVDPNQAVDHIYHLTPVGSPVLLENYIQNGVSILDSIYKSGIATGITEAVVFTIDASLTTTGDNPSNYNDLVGATGAGWCKPGDSGSGVFEGNGYFVGILCIGTGSYLGMDAGFVCKAQHILDAIGTGYSFTPHKNTYLDEPPISFIIPTYNLTVAVSPVGAGTTSPPEGGTTSYSEDAAVALEATANNGYIFDHWQFQGSNISTSVNANVSLKIIGNTTATAIFTVVTQPVTYTLTMAVSPTGAGITTPTGIITFNIPSGEGATANVTATANPSYVFDHWDLSNGGIHQTSSVNPLTINIINNITATAVFNSTTPTTYTITTNVSGNGTVSPSTSQYTQGTHVNLTATPGSDSVFSYWKDSNGNTYNTATTPVVVAANITYTAYFIPQSTPPPAGPYTLTVTIVGQGTVSPTGGSFPANTIMALTATPSPGWVFSAWSNNFTGTNTTAYIQMVQNMNITATFIQQSVPPAGPYTLTIGVVGQGTVTPTGGSFPANSIQTLTATPRTGWVFSAWSGNFTSVNPIAYVQMVQNMNVTATFIQQTLPPAGPYTLTINIVGQGAVNPIGGSFNANSAVTLAATPSPGWVFSAWSGGLTGTNSTTNMQMVQNMNVTATFIQQSQVTYALSVNCSPTGSGSVLPSGGDYNAGALVTLTATPASGYSFGGWSGDLGGTANPATLTVNGSMTIYANFTKEGDTTTTSPIDMSSMISMMMVVMMMSMIMQMAGSKA